MTTARIVETRRRRSSDNAIIVYLVIVVVNLTTRTTPIVPTTDALLTSFYPSSSSSAQVTPCHRHGDHRPAQQTTLIFRPRRVQPHILLPPDLSSHLYSTPASPSTTHSSNDDNDDANALPPIKWKQRLQRLKIRNQQSMSLSRRILGDLFYGLSSPFPDLRNILRTRSRDDTSRSDDNEDDRHRLVASLTLRNASLAIISYLTVGVLAYHVLFEKWSIVDALYFSCVCFSTVGYGDLCPKTKLGKLFTCIFGFAGIALLGAAVANIGTKLIQLEADTVQMVQRESRKRVLDVYEKLPHVVGHLKKKHINEDDGATKEEAEVVDMQREHLVEQVVTSKKLLPDEDHDMTTIVDVVPTSSIRSRVESAGKVLRTALIWTTKAFLPVVGGGLLIGRLEGWGAYDSIYYSLITASTIGLGDLYPKTRSGRLAAVLLIPILVATAGDILAGIGKALIERRQKRMFTAQMEKGYMNDYNIIKAMDINGDGRVSREEYVVFMLTEMGFVSKDEIDELWKQFDRLVDQSKSEGHIEAEDLLLMQAIRRRTEEV